MTRRDSNLGTPSIEPAAAAVHSPLGCPFREFKDSELGADIWGHGPEVSYAAKASLKSMPNLGTWIDEQVQPLPRSVRVSFDRWARPDDVISSWSPQAAPFHLLVCKEVTGNEPSTMKTQEIQITYADIIHRSSFCRRVLSVCYLLERVENFVVEFQSEHFVFSTGSEGWLPRFQIYSPGLKPGGGQHHRPVLSKNGCYMVRLYYIGAWRCVWVSDAIPVDASGTALLPFAPLAPGPPPPPTTKTAKPPPLSPRIVPLWPLLICKALLKLSAIDMTTVDDLYEYEDENIEKTNFLHHLTGGLTIEYKFQDSESMWEMFCKEVAVFSWDKETEEKQSPAAVKSGKVVKKAAVKDTQLQSRRKAFVSAEVADTAHVPAYALPTLSPAYEMPMLVTMARDLPLMKPPDEPAVPLWKTYRWVDWAREHGLYDGYECPRKKWLKSFALLRLSRAMHLLDVRSAQSITNVNAVNLDKAKVHKAQQETKTSIVSKKSNMSITQASSSELREWLDYEMLYRHIRSVKLVNLPSMHTTACAGNATYNPPAVVSGKSAPPPTSKLTVLRAPTDMPMFLQIDSAVEVRLFISLSTLHPNILANVRHPPMSPPKLATLLLERMEWIADEEEDPMDNAVAVLETNSYESLVLTCPAGRHAFRLWVSSSQLWHACLMSEGNLYLTERGEAMQLATTECQWATEVLFNISNTFLNWIKSTQHGRNMVLARMFYKSCSPDKEWDAKKIGYPQKMLHWMFSKAFAQFLHRNLEKRNSVDTFYNLRNLFIDPYFGSSEPPEPSIMCQMLDRCKCFKQDSTTTITLLCEKASELPEDETPKPRKERFPFEYIEGRQCMGPCNTHQIACGIVDSGMLYEMEVNKAARLIQSNWRRVRCKRMLSCSTVSPEFIKTMSDILTPSSGMTKLMNIFFKMFPHVDSAYTISSAIGELYGCEQYYGTYVASSRDVWIPLFMGDFFCHSPTRIQFDLDCHLRKKELIVFDNDTKTKLTVDVSSQRNYDFKPNTNGYDVHGYAWRSLSALPQDSEEIQWKLTIISTEKGSFHFCDNNTPRCEEGVLSEAFKMTFDEVYFPNRERVLAAARLYVTRATAVSFRVTTTSPGLKIEASLYERSRNSAEDEALCVCSGYGDLFWAPVGLEPLTPNLSFINLMPSNTQTKSGSIKQKSQTKKPTSSSANSRKGFKLGVKRTQTHFPQPDARIYEIEVRAPEGWALTSHQWARVEEMWNPVETQSVSSARKSVKFLDAVTAALASLSHTNNLQSSIGGDEHRAPATPSPGDAGCCLEVCVGADSEVAVERYNKRELRWLSELESWKREARHAACALIRDEFRETHLEPFQQKESSEVVIVEPELLPFFEVHEEEESLESVPYAEKTYLTRPKHLQEKFRPLEFLAECTREEVPQNVTVLTEEAVEAAAAALAARTAHAHATTDLYSVYNAAHVRARQKKRNLLFDKLQIDSGWGPELSAALELRDEQCKLNSEALTKTIKTTSRMNVKKRK